MTCLQVLNAGLLAVLLSGSPEQQSTVSPGHPEATVAGEAPRWDASGLGMLAEQAIACVDLNNDGSKTALSPWNDWEHIVFDGGLVGDTAGVSLPDAIWPKEPAAKVLRATQKVLLGDAARPRITVRVRSKGNWAPANNSRSHARPTGLFSPAPPQIKTADCCIKGWSLVANCDATRPHNRAENLQARPHGIMVI